MHEVVLSDDFLGFWHYLLDFLQSNVTFLKFRNIDSNLIFQGVLSRSFIIGLFMFSSSSTQLFPIASLVKVIKNFQLQLQVRPGIQFEISF